MVILILLIVGMSAGYDLKCPANSEWRLRANVSCYSEDTYVCLFHLLENRYEDNCLGSDLSSIGSKLVFQPLFNLAECNDGRYQPVVFTTHGNSECFLIKSKCSEEGQVLYSNGSSSVDITCRCDYTQGYAFVSKPKNSCFCLPSEEDCSCFRVNCSKLSPDYHCITDLEKNASCQEIYLQKTYNRHNQTVKNIKRNIRRYFTAHFVGFIMLILIPVFIASVVLMVIAFECKESELQQKRARDVEKKKLIQKGECGKHHFARLVFIGKNGVGKTSLMRRLLWQNKKEVLSTESTDGIEIEKCNINITNGEWSLCDNIDNDLSRLINQVYTEKKQNTTGAAVKTIPSSCLKDFDQVNSRNNTSLGIIMHSFRRDDLTENETRFDKYIAGTRSQTSSDGYYGVEFGSETNTDSSINHLSWASDNKRGNINKSMHDIQANVEYLNDSTTTLIESEKENGQAIKYDEDIDKMTSAIMEGCLQRKGAKQYDSLAFCWLWDFAGEKDYYATHQVFLSTCAVYLLVTDSLEFNTSKMLWTDIEDSAQYVNFWFDAIHCYWSNTEGDQLDPPIIVVCTNQDQFKDLSEQQKRQDQFKENLGQALNKQNKKNHLRNIYFVSNTEDDDSVFKEIRQCISNQAMDMKDWGKDCPLKWLLFQQVLGKLKDSNVHISTTKTLIEIAKHEDIGINRYEDVKRCLKYCHDIGTVIYFDEEYLEEYVILDPKWLVNAFRCLVSDKFGNVILASDDWQTLRETGELTQLLISRLFSKEPELKFLENKTHLIEVMKKFDIIVSLRNSISLYMPCMMKSYSFDEFRDHFIDGRKTYFRSSWLCLEYKFLPPAFFNHILAWFIKQYFVSVILDKGTRNERKALYRQIGVFDLGLPGCEQLVVCEGRNIIALQVWNALKSDKTYGYLENDLLQFMDTLRDRYKLKIAFTKTLKCNTGDFTIHRQKMDDLYHENYFCIEHNRLHSTYDLVAPWDLYAELQILQKTKEEEKKREEEEMQKKEKLKQMEEERSKKEERRINPFDQSIGEVLDNLDSAIADAHYVESFVVRFLGLMEVKANRGEPLVFETMRQIMAARARNNVFRMTESRLVVSSNNMKLIDPSTNFVQTVFALADISFWAAHKENKRLFGFITRNRQTDLPYPSFACHVFECNVSAEEICSAIQTATKLAFQAFMLSEKIERGISTHFRRRRSEKF